MKQLGPQKSSAAVSFKDVRLRLGRGRTATAALDGVNLSATAGEIYGLLGPSGCGKTSVLGCTLGIHRPDSGQVLVFGRIPGASGLGVPGAAVGFMPQAISLHSYFNAKEILRYYGELMQLKAKELEQRIRFLLRELDLEAGDVWQRPIGRLSGGQQRRISLACALLHRPKLLVLDEPTVGVDPVLRTKVWAMLRASSNSTTVLITTHYMEEAAKADKIGFLRRGRLLREGCPETLKKNFGIRDLDQVFYRLCQQDEESENANNYEKVTGDEEIGDDIGPVVNETNGWTMLKALLYKNAIIIKRHAMFMLFQAFVPVVTFLIFLTCIGPPVKDLSLAVYNGDTDNCNGNNLTRLTCPGELPLSFSLGNDVSCHILSKLDSDVFADVRDHESLAAATESVRLGLSHAVMSFQSGFSSALSQRVVEALRTSPEALDLSEVKVSLDATNVEIARTSVQAVVVAIQKFLVDYANGCNLDELEDMFKHPGLKFHWFLGEEKMNISHNMLPAAMTLILHLLAMALTADVLITEKEAGLLVRDFVCGVSLPLYLVAQLLVFSLVAISQLAFSLVLLCAVFPTLPFSHVVILAILLLLEILAGMALGLLLTALFKDRDQVIQAGMAVVFPEFMLSGILWPAQAMPPVLYAISMALPATISAELAREIVFREDFLDDVRLASAGFLIPLAYTIMFFTTCVLIIRRWGFKV